MKGLLGRRRPSASDDQKYRAADILFPVAAAGAPFEPRLTTTDGLDILSIKALGPIADVLDRVFAVPLPVLASACAAH